MLHLVKLVLKKNCLFTIFLLAFIVPRPIAAQHSLVGTYWHNGSEYIPILSETDSTLATVTMTLHEGSSVTLWRKTVDPNVFLIPTQIGNAWTDTIIHYYDSIVHTFVAGQEVLLRYGCDRKLEDILLRYDGSSKNERYAQSHGFDSILISDAKNRICGSYVVGQEMWKITQDSINRYSLLSIEQHHSSQRTPYRILWELDHPTTTLELGDGKFLWYEFTAHGIDLFNGISHIEEEGEVWVEKGELLCNLTKDNIDSAIPGRWPEGSARLLTRGYLAPYPTEALRLIRNEIYARHGHRFSDKALTEFYHSGGLWYGTALLNAQEPLVLTEIEKLNVALIATMEKERKTVRR